MGTRNLVCVTKDGEYKVAQYGQWDGYPEGQGITVLAFVSNTDKLAKLRKYVDNLVFINEDKLNKMWHDTGADFDKTHPEFSRDTGADILDLIIDNEGNLEIKNSLEFARDSLFCEYGYVINLDRNVLEVYEGCNKTQLDKNERFSVFKPYEEYYPIRFAVEFDLDNLPDKHTFVEECCANFME